MSKKPTPAPRAREPAKKEPRLSKRSKREAERYAAEQLKDWSKDDYA